MKLKTKWLPTKMLIAPQRNYQKDSTSGHLFTEIPLGLKTVLKCQDEGKVPCFGDNSDSRVMPTKVNTGNLEDSRESAKKMEGEIKSCETTERFPKTRLEKRYRTNSTDSAFSEESFLAWDGDENTNLESLIDQLIFIDDKRNFEASTFIESEKTPSTTDSTCLIDDKDKSNISNPFSLNFEAMARESRASSFLEKEERLDSENTESISSILSTDSGKYSVQKYPTTKMSAFLESNIDMFLDNANNDIIVNENFTKYSKDLSPSSDKTGESNLDNSILCHDSFSIADSWTKKNADCFENKTSLSSNIDSSDTGDNSVSNGVHEYSFVDLSNFLDNTSHGSPFAMILPVDSQKCFHSTDHFDAGTNDIKSSKTIFSDLISSSLDAIKGNDNDVFKANDLEGEVLLAGVDFWTMNEEDPKIGTSLTPMKSCFKKCLDISGGPFDENINNGNKDCLENNARNYGDQEMSDKNNDFGNLLTEGYNEIIDRVTFKNAHQGNNLVPGLHSSENKYLKLEFSIAKDSKECMENCKDENILMNGNDSVVVHNYNELDPVKYESGFFNSEFLNEVGCDYVSRKQVGCDYVSRKQVGCDNVSRTQVEYDNVSRTQVEYDNVSRTQVECDNVSRTQVGSDYLSRKQVGGDNVSRTQVGCDNVSRTQVGDDYLSRTQVGWDNVSQTQGNIQNEWLTSHKESIRGIITKEHSYRNHLPFNPEQINRTIINSKEKNLPLIDFPVKRIPSKRPILKDSKPREISLKTECATSAIVLPSFQFLLEEEPFSNFESLLKEPKLEDDPSAFHSLKNSDYIENKVQKCSSFDNDDPRIQSAILYQVLAMEENSTSNPILSSSPLKPLNTKISNVYSPRNPNEHHCKIRYVTRSIRPDTMSTRDEQKESEMKELEKYLRGIIPAESDDKQGDKYVDHHHHQQQHKNGVWFLNEQKTRSSFLEKLLTGEMSVQMYREIDRQFQQQQQQQ